MDLSICPKFERAINLLSQRWTGLIIYALLEGPKRFCQIETSIGISGRVLSQRLKELEKEGIIKREVLPGDARSHRIFPDRQRKSPRTAHPRNRKMVSAMAGRPRIKFGTTE